MYITIYSGRKLQAFTTLENSPYKMDLKMKMNILRAIELHKVEWATNKYFSYKIVITIYYLWSTVSSTQLLRENLELQIFTLKQKNWKLNRNNQWSENIKNIMNNYFHEIQTCSIKHARADDIVNVNRRRWRLKMLIFRELSSTLHKLLVSGCLNKGVKCKLGPNVDN